MVSWAVVVDLRDVKSPNDGRQKQGLNPEWKVTIRASDLQS